MTIARTPRRSPNAFSLLELVILVMILGIIAAIAIPRMSRGSAGAQEAALKANLRVLRDAIDRYAAEHDGKFPAILTALTKYTDAAGAVSDTKTSTYIYGPYIHRIPPCPTGPRIGETGWAAAGTDPPTVVSNTPTVGWLYDPATGGVWVNDVNHLDK